MLVAQAAGNENEVGFSVERNDAMDWVRIAACGSLLAGGLLYLFGHRRAGLATAVTGATLALLDQQDLVRLWWKQMPGYVDQVHQLLDDVENLVEDVSTRREKLHQVLGKSTTSVAATPAEP